MRDGRFFPVLEYILKDEHGDVIKEGKKEAESFTLAFLRMLAIQFEGHSDFAYGPFLTNTLVDVDGASTRISPNCHNFFSAAAIGDTTFGLAVGTSDQAPSFLDYSLIAKVPHGTALGEIQYGVQGYGLPAADPLQAHVRLSRVFANSSGATITVKEAGIIVMGYRQTYPWLTSVATITAATNRANFLIARDLVDAPLGVDVLDGMSLTINYNLVCPV